MKEALKLALEALETIVDAIYINSAQEAAAFVKADGAITAIKAALAQTEQEPDRFCDANCTWSDHHPDCKYGTQAPPKREWVGLTDEDHMQFAISQFGWDELIEAVEAKLKEKNNG